MAADYSDIAATRQSATASLKNRRQHHAMVKEAKRKGRFAIQALKAYLSRMSWHLCFDEPITLEDGTALTSLRDAIAYLAQSIPETEHLMKEVQAAAHCVTQAAENGGPLLFARIGMMQAINRHKPRVLDPSRKEPHWARRKPKRDANR
jgi:hypothetical protein